MSEDLLRAAARRWLDPTAPSPASPPAPARDRAQGPEHTPGMHLEGGCHCGDLRVTYETEIPPERTTVRLCQCTFCRRHNARAATDPAGHLTITIAAGAQPSRYVFGLRTAEFLLCPHCGVYVAAVMADGDRTYATVNLNALDRRAEFPAGTAIIYDGEDAAARIARRRERWTPATVRSA